MTAQVSEVVIDAADPYALATFWSAVLDVPLDEDDEPGDENAFLDAGDGSTPLLFQAVPEAKAGKNRLHLDVCASEGSTREAEVERIVALGATVLADRRTPPGGGWVVLADPEGNEFCVVRNAAEHAATPGH